MMTLVLAEDEDDDLGFSGTETASMILKAKRLWRTATLTLYVAMPTAADLGPNLRMENVLLITFQH